MSERSKAAKVADEHYEVTFDGFNRFKQETFSSEEYWRLENNWKHRDHFIAGYERALKDIEQKSVPDTSVLEARAGGLDKAAEICRYHAGLPMRNEASKAMARDIETSCLATAGRIRRGEYENPTSDVMQTEKDSSR